MIEFIRDNQPNSPINFVFALESGDIGYTISLKFPIRKHNVVQGAYPKKGDLSDNSWQGFVPLSELPYVVNPSSGYIVSANNQITSGNTKHGISHAFASQHRVIRIKEMLDSFIGKKDKMTVGSMKSIALDTLDIQARASLPDMVLLIKGLAKHK